MRNLGKFTRTGKLAFDLVALTNMKYSTRRKNPNMKSIMKSILGLQITAVFLTLALAAPAAATPGPDQQLPFKGTLQVLADFDVQFPTLFVDATGSGTATHLGRFTATFQEEANLVTGQGIGSGHFIAANGDSVFTEFIGQVSPTEDPDVALVVSTHTITGGTGRFEGASGSFTGHLLVNLVTGIGESSFDGTILKAK